MNNDKALQADVQSPTIGTTMKPRGSSKKVKVGIIGTGNIGTDLLIKIQRSEILECGMFSGQNSNSEGIKRAKQLGIPTSCLSIKAIENDPKCCDIVFDATTSEAHEIHAPILRKLKKYTIDMTPSRIGKMCIPSINLEESLKEQEVNMVSCGGQATTPLIVAIMTVHPETPYVEIVSSISSKSAGMGTRDNIDEYTQTTGEGIRYLTHVPSSKAIIILNPAEPPIFMRNTIYAKIDNPKLDALTDAIKSVVKKIRTYVPGYTLLRGPVYENNRVTTMIEVAGRGDFLPVYAGNLDIINCAAIEVAEAYAKRKL